MQLRGTQPKFTDSAVKFLLSKSTKKSVWVAPVAYGKSICIANIVSRLDAPVVILQPNKELLEQNYSKFVNSGGTATVCSKSFKKFIKNKRPYTEINGETMLCDEVSEVTYATPGSIKSKIDEVKAIGVKYLIIDECHLNTKSASVIKKFMNAAKIKKVLGVTATPVILSSGFGGSSLKIMTSAKVNLFSNLGHVVQIQEMIESGFWSKLVYDVKQYSREGLVFNTTGSDYTKESLKINYHDNNIEPKCVTSVKELRAEGRKSIIIFVPMVEDALRLQKLIKGSAVVHGELKTEEREDILRRFKSLELDVVINVEILTTGFDHPQLDAIVLARPTASIALYYQIIGRITRIHPDKPNGRIVDLSGNVYKFGKVEYLNYEYIEGYGWGLFTNESLLTDHPLKSLERPNKNSIKYYSGVEGWAAVKKANKVTLWFGKHAGKEIQFIDRNYLTYILDNFENKSDKILRLKEAIRTILKIK